MSIFKKYKDMRRALQDAGLPYDYRICVCCGGAFIPRQHNIRPLICPHCQGNHCEFKTTDEGIVISHIPRHEIQLFHVEDHRVKHRWENCHFIGLAKEFAKSNFGNNHLEDGDSSSNTATGSWVKQPPDGDWAGYLYGIAAIIKIYRGGGRVAFAHDTGSMNILKDPTKWEITQG